ncbi:MAG: TetR/AcrR family transcriptional regulator [Thermodesulfobacteriota bacterium]
MPAKAQQNRQEQTIGKIVDAATRLFAESGYAGASVDEIARAAGVNKATIYYHVGDKDKLYQSVLHDVIGSTVQNVVGNLSENQTPEEKLTTYIRGVAETVERYPPLPPVMMRAVETGGQGLSQEVAADLVMIFGILLGILEEGVSRGAFIQTNPFLIYLMILGAIAFHKNVEATWNGSRSAARMLRQLDPCLFDKLEGSIRKDVAEEVSRLMLRALKK